MYKIGELSRMCRIPVKTLRYYADIGLLVPDSIDRFTGYRYYAAQKLALCALICTMKELGFSLSEIKSQITAKDEGELLMLLEAKRCELEAERESVTRKLRAISELKERIKEDKKLFNIVIGRCDVIRVAAKRKIYRDKSEAFDEIIKIREGLPERIAGTRRVIINHEPEFKEGMLDLTACVEISSALPSACIYDEVTVTFADEVASLVCREGELDDAYRELERYTYASGRVITGSFYEIFHEDGTVELKAPVELSVRLSSSARRSPFEEDPEVLGRWNLIDIVPSASQFTYGHPKCTLEKEHEICFLKGGMGYWIYDGWTRGRLYRRFDGLIAENRYEIRYLDGKKLLFIRENMTDRGKPITACCTHVYEEIYSGELSREDISIKDNTDYPFIPDEAVLGKWTVRDFHCGFVPDEFDPEVQNRPDCELFLRSLEFCRDGICIHETKSGSSRLPYTRGLLLNHNTGTAPAYEIRQADGREYLFLEWKSGDYVYSGRINMYVLER